MTRNDPPFAPKGRPLRILALLSVRNEAVFLPDWLAHHRAVGFTDVLAFSNDCQDGTGAMLDRMQALGLLVHQPNPGPHPQGVQWSALEAAARHPLMQDADWVMCLDIDEFVNVHVGDGSLAALLAALPEADAVAMTWRLFGNDGVLDRGGRAVTETFLRAAPRVMWWPWRALMIKTLYRNDGRYRRPGVHRPRALDRSGPAPRWFGGAGIRLPAAFEGTRLFSDPGHDPYGLVQLNHYPLGSMQDYILKCDRGRANRATQPFDMSYWVERNLTDVEDRSILTPPGQVGEKRGRLLASLLADPELAQLVDQARDWRARRFATLMRDESWRWLFGRLLMSRPSRPLNADEARMIWQLGQG